MKHAEWRVGELVQVPHSVMFPTYTGWNRYKFAEGIIVARAVGKKDPFIRYAIVDVTNPYNGTHERHQYRMDNVFRR